MELTKATQHWKGDFAEVGTFAGGSQSHVDYVHAMIFEGEVARHATSYDANV